MLTLSPPMLWATWQELRSESKANSEAIFSKMLEAKVSDKKIDASSVTQSPGPTSSKSPSIVLSGLHLSDACLAGVCSVYSVVRALRCPGSPEIAAQD